MASQRDYPYGVGQSFYSVVAPVGLVWPSLLCLFVLSLAEWGRDNLNVALRDRLPLRVPRSVVWPSHIRFSPLATCVLPALSRHFEFD